MTSAGTSIDVAYSGIASVVHSAETKARSARQLRFSGACGKNGDASSAKKSALAAATARAVVEPKHAAEAEREAVERMRELKATLYSKFGDSINLEA